MLATKFQDAIASLQRIGITKAKIGFAGLSISWKAPEKCTRPTMEIYRESKTIMALHKKPPKSQKSLRVE